MSRSDLHDWTPGSWREKPIGQQPTYDNLNELNRVLSDVHQLPPLVFSGEVENLKRQLAEAAQGKRFLLQGGDCAERFADCNPQSIADKIKILLQMSVILAFNGRKPVIRVGRIAGQYAKPRSSELETRNGRTAPSYRGDIINSFEFDQTSRQPNPERLRQSYQFSSLTLNYIRALSIGGFADLRDPEKWRMAAHSDSPHEKRYAALAREMRKAIEFVSALGSIDDERISGIEFFTSHEGLLLCYEEAMTRKSVETGRYYNLGAHMLWLGDRTRELQGAHVEYFRGIDNPIGIKIGPSADPREIVELIEILNPRDEAGRITLITRLGKELVTEKLSALIKSILKRKRSVLWSCDPMHGNMIRTEQGIKTRDFDAILDELKEAFRIHKECGSLLGGVHFELTGENVTECIGGAGGITCDDLTKNYETYCDPRLNYSQSLEMAFLSSTLLQS